MLPYPGIYAAHLITMETSGVLGPLSLTFLKELLSHTVTQKVKPTCSQHLSVAIQMGIQGTLISWSTEAELAYLSLLSGWPQDRTIVITAPYVRLNQLSVKVAINVIHGYKYTVASLPSGTS